jgi:SET domain-containing protein 6
MKSILPIAKGEEIFNDYGPLPSSDLLRRYGYITQNYSRYDVVELSRDTIVQAAKKRFSASERWIDEQLASEDDEIPDGFLIPRLDSVESPIEAFEDFLPLLTLVVPLDESTSGLKRKLISKVLGREEAMPYGWKQVMTDAVSDRLSTYGPTTLEQDRILLADATETWKRYPQQSIARKVLALQVRIGEKEILKSALEWLGSQDEVPSTKRQKV